MADELNLERLNELEPQARSRVENALSETLARELERVGGASVRPARDRSQFQAALSRLSTDAEYRTQATADPTLLTSDFKLSLKELQAMRQVAVLSGADVAVVDRVRASSITRGSVTALDSVDVSCCSCCCCCCGDTAVALRG